MTFSQKGHFDPPSGYATTYIRVIQGGDTVGWGWVERHPTDSRTRLQAWVRGPDFDATGEVDSRFAPRDDTDFPGGAPSTRAQFFTRLAAQWTSGASTVHCEAHADEGLPPDPPSGEFDPGTELMYDSGDNHRGYLFVDEETDFEHFVSYGATVGPDQVLVLKPPGSGSSAFSDYDAFVTAMYAFLDGKGTPHRHEVTTQSVQSGVVAPSWGS